MAQRRSVVDTGTYLTGATGSNNAEVEIGNISLFNYGTTGSFTVSFWMQSTGRAVAGNKCMVGKCLGVGNFAGWRILADSTNGRIFGQVGDDTINTTTTTASTPFFFDGKWHHILLEVNRTTQLMSLYVDSVLNSAPVSIASIGSLSNASSLRFFRDGGGNNRYGGNLDEIRIFNGVMTAIERANLYYNDVLPSNRLDGQWLFDEGSGSTALDTSGNGNNGTISLLTYSSVNPITSRRRKVQNYGTQLKFNGTTNQVNLDGATFGASLSQITIAAWVKTRPGAQQFIFSRPAGTSDQFEIGATGIPSVSLNIGGNRTLLASQAISDSQWSHVAVTYDGANIKIFVNGLLSNSTAVTGSLTNTGTSWDIGHRAGSGLFSGILDNLVVWSRSLTDAEIADVYTNSAHPRTSLVLEYLCNEGFGSSLIDGSGNGNTGIITGCIYVNDPVSIPRTISQNMGSALRFISSSGSNRVTVNHNPNYTFGRNCSVSFWFKPATLQIDAALVSKGIGSATPIDIRYLSGGSIATFVYDGTFQPAASTPAPYVLVPGRSYYVVSTTDSSFVRLYINGILVSSTTNTTVATTDNTTNITIGSRTGGTQWLDGSMDEVRIYNTTLTTDEISSMYLNNIVPRNGLIAEYLFNEGTGTTALDTSGNGNNGTITGATYTSDTPLNPRPIVRDMGTSLRFGGASSNVRNATPLSHVVQNTPMAFSFWMNTNEFTPDGTIFANRIDDVTGNLHFGWRVSTSRIEGAFFATGSIYTGRFATPRLEKNKWYQITIVYDGTTLNQGTDGVDIYVNGVRQPRVSTNFGGAGGSFNFTLGAQTTSSNRFEGVLDEFRTWNRALTDVEIRDMYFNNIVPRTGLVTEYLFNEGSGTTALDTAGNNPGTITGDATYTLDTPLKPRSLA